MCQGAILNRLEETAIAWPVNGMPHTLAERTRRVYDRLAAVYPVSTMFFHSRAHGCALGASGLRDAQVMLVRFSKVLGRLLRKHRQSSALRDELSLIEDHLAIEVGRFGDVLKFVGDAADDTLDMLVPSMLLQPLGANSTRP